MCELRRFFTQFEANVFEIGLIRRGFGLIKRIFLLED